MTACTGMTSAGLPAKLFTPTLGSSARSVRLQPGPSPGTPGLGLSLEKCLWPPPSVLGRLPTPTGMGGSLGAPGLRPATLSSIFDTCKSLAVLSDTEVWGLGPGNHLFMMFK